MKVLNEQTLDSLRELDADTGGTLLAALIKAYGSEVPDRLTRLGEFIDARDREKVHFEAHGIKSTFANFGGEEAANILGKIEDAGKNADWSGIADLVTQLGRARVEFEADLELLRAEVLAKK